MQGKHGHHICIEVHSETLQTSRKFSPAGRAKSFVKLDGQPVFEFSRESLQGLDSIRHNGLIAKQTHHNSVSEGYYQISQGSSQW